MGNYDRSAAQLAVAREQLVFARGWFDDDSESYKAVTPAIDAVDRVMLVLERLHVLADRDELRIKSDHLEDQLFRLDALINPTDD